jgi:hypothetical protein
MSKTVRLIYNTIVGGKFYFAGEPIEKDILPANLHKFIAKPAVKESTESNERNLMFSLNQRYSVDSDGYLRPSAGQQAAEMEAAATEDDRIADHLAEGEVSPEVAAAVEEAREQIRAEVEKEKLQASIRTRRQEEAGDFVREEQDEQVASGEFDQWDAASRRDPPARPAAGPRVSAKSKRSKVKGQRSYVKRNGSFVSASDVEVIAGESLYRFRPKSFGVSERYIRFGKVKKESKHSK